MSELVLDFIKSGEWGKSIMCIGGHLQRTTNLVVFGKVDNGTLHVITSEEWLSMWKGQHVRVLGGACGCRHGCSKAWILSNEKHEDTIVFDHAKVSALAEVAEMV